MSLLYRARRGGPTVRKPQNGSCPAWLLLEWTLTLYPPPSPQHTSCIPMYLPPIAHKNGRFNAELAPMEVKGKKGMEPFTHDEHPRTTSLEKLGTLAPVFKEKGCVSAGNASVGLRISL